MPLTQKVHVQYNLGKTTPSNNRQKVLPLENRHFKILATTVIATEHDDGIEPGIWARLNKSEQAVLPVIVRHADKYGRSFPGEHRISKMTDLDRKTVRNATHLLERRGLIKTSKFRTKTGHWQKKYDAKKICSNDSGVNLPSAIFDIWKWATLRPCAKSLIPVILYFSRPRPELDQNYEYDSVYGRWLERDDFLSYLETRKADYCDAEPSILCDFAGISRRSFSSAIKNLVENNIIAPHPDRRNGWQVFVRPENNQ